MTGFAGKWFQPLMKSLFHLENQWDDCIGSQSDKMPVWAQNSLGKGLDLFEIKPAKPEMTDERKFGILLEAKTVDAINPDKSPRGR